MRTGSSISCQMKMKTKLPRNWPACRAFTLCSLSLSFSLTFSLSLSLRCAGSFQLSDRHEAWRWLGLAHGRAPRQAYRAASLAASYCVRPVVPPQPQRATCSVCHRVSFSVHFVYSSKAVHVTEATALFAAFSPNEQQQTEHNNNDNNYKLVHSNNCAQQQQQHKNDKNDSCRRQSIRNYFGQSIKEIYAKPPKSSWPRKVQNKAWALCVCVRACIRKSVWVCAHISSLFILENV